MHVAKLPLLFDSPTLVVNIAQRPNASVPLALLLYAIIQSSVVLDFAVYRAQDN